MSIWKRWAFLIDGQTYACTLACIWRTWLRSWCTHSCSKSFTVSSPTCGCAPLREPLTNPRTRAGDLRYLKELYFDGYYHFIYCHYKFGQAHKVEAKRQEYVSKAAALILALEGGKDREAWNLVGERLRDLLRHEAGLRSAYEELKARTP